MAGSAFVRWQEWVDSYMAGKGKEFDFHGCYREKADAVAKEKEVGGFIRERTVLGRKCYLVLTAKKK